MCRCRASMFRSVWTCSGPYFAGVGGSKYGGIALGLQSHETTRSGSAISPRFPEFVCPPRVGMLRARVAVEANQPSAGRRAGPRMDLVRDDLPGESVLEPDRPRVVVQPFTIAPEAAHGVVGASRRPRAPDPFRHLRREHHYTRLRELGAVEIGDHREDRPVARQVRQVAYGKRVEVHVDDWALEHVRAKQFQLAPPSRPTALQRDFPHARDADGRVRQAHEVERAGPMLPHAPVERADVFGAVVAAAAKDACESGHATSSASTPCDSRWAAISQYRSSIS